MLTDQLVSPLQTVAELDGFEYPPQHYIPNPKIHIIPFPQIRQRYPIKMALKFQLVYAKSLF